MVTNFIGKIGVFGQHSFIYRAGVPKVIEISERRWACEKCIECGIVVHKFGKILCSNYGDPFAHFLYLCEKCKISISGQLSQNILD